MNIDQFWQIIEVTQASSEEEQIALFSNQLQQLSSEDIIEFHRIYTERLFAAYSWDLWVVAWLCEGGTCSDDSFLDFRSWLISRGRAIYEAAMEDADLLVDEMRQTECPAFESFGGVPCDVYEEKTGQPLPEQELQHPREPNGGDWLRPELKDRTGSPILNLCVVFYEMGDQEYTAIEKRFPRIWELCVQRGTITTNAQSIAQPDPGGIPTPEEVAATVDPNLASTDFAAYLKALNEAAQKAYKKEE